MLMTCLISTTTLGLQPAWFTPFHLFWTEKLLYFVFVDIFHSLVIPLMMARTIPWENPKGERGKSTFYVRQTNVLEPRRPISIQSGTRPSVEPDRMKTWESVEADRMKTSSLKKPTTLLLPADTAPWIPTPMEEGTLEKFPGFKKVVKSQIIASTVPFLSSEAQKVKMSAMKVKVKRTRLITKKPLMLHNICKNRIFLIWSHKCKIGNTFVLVWWDCLKVTRT